jgi:glycosyltransferase
MKVTVITVCYNRSNYWKSHQKCLGTTAPRYYEYIIIDGNSTDGTKAIIETFSDKISLYVSEPDKECTDAINKGIKLATGTIIGLMHSDDEFYDTSTISKIVAFWGW